MYIYIIEYKYNTRWVPHLACQVYLANEKDAAKDECLKMAEGSSYQWRVSKYERKEEI